MKYYFSDDKLRKIMPILNKKKEGNYFKVVTIQKLKNSSN